MSPVGFSSEATGKFRETDYSGPPFQRLSYLHQISLPQPTDQDRNPVETHDADSRRAQIAFSQRWLRSRLFFNAIAIFRKTYYLASLRTHIDYRRRSFAVNPAFKRDRTHPGDGQIFLVTDPPSLNSKKIHTRRHSRASKSNTHRIYRAGSRLSNSDKVKKAITGEKNPITGNEVGYLGDQAITVGTQIGADYG